MVSAQQFVGIDVSKGWLDIAQRPGGETRRVENSEEGWEQLVTDLRGAGESVVIVLEATGGYEAGVVIALEATGGYEAGVVIALDAAGLTPVVANPISHPEGTRRFAQSLGRRAKTDRIAPRGYPAMLAEYAERMRPTPRPIPEETARILRELLVRRRQLTKLMVEEQNHLKRASALVRPQVIAMLAMLKTQRNEINKLLASTVASDRSWQARVDQLETVPGFATYMATLVAVGLPELGRCTGKEAAALVGVAPHPRESGQVRGQRHISAGRGPLRHALYEAMTTTKRCDPTFGAHYAQLKARGKTHKQAMVACIRRLLGIITAMVRDGLTWAQTKVGQGTFLAVTH